MKKLGFANVVIAATVIFAVLLAIILLPRESVSEANYHQDAVAENLLPSLPEPEHYEGLYEETERRLNLDDIPERFFVDGLLDMEKYADYLNERDDSSHFAVAFSGNNRIPLELMIAEDIRTVDEEAQALLALLKERSPFPIFASTFERYGTEYFAEPEGEAMWVHHIVPIAQMDAFRSASIMARKDMPATDYINFEIFTSLVDLSVTHVFELLFVE